MNLNFSIQEITSVAKQLLEQYAPLKIFCFEGELGAGKTTLIESICKSLGSESSLSSPTFSIVNEYDSTHGSLFHMDWYRLRSEEEAIQAGIEEYLFKGSYCFIEWHRVAESLIPRPYVLIQLTHAEDNQRHLASQIIS